MLGIKILDAIFETLGIGIGVLIFVMFTEYVKERISVLIHDIKYRHKQKHRFDKKPQAKCYCVDCKYWNAENHQCNCKSLYTTDSWFCSDAKPRKHEHTESEVAKHV